jgi:hemerythrin superfamily protein
MLLSWGRKLASPKMAPGVTHEAKRTGGEAAMNAVDMLKHDHKKVKGLFKQFEEEENERAKGDIVAETLRELEVHAAIEEEIFYPAVRERINEEDLMDEAEEEHLAAKRLMADLSGMEPGDERYDAKYTVLAEMVKHHIEEEEGEMLPKAERSGVDLEALGEAMRERKDELTQESLANGSGRPAAASGRSELAPRAGAGRMGESGNRRARAARAGSAARSKTRSRSHAGRR